MLPYGRRHFCHQARRDPMAKGAGELAEKIVKGWLDKKGKTHERIYDLAVSDERKIGAEGRCKTPVGNTVDLEAATWTNTIGAPELITVWTDPEFDAEVSAAYYARVLESPTPRWTAYEAKRFGIKMKDEIQMVTVERTYTSPIWYTPSGCRRGYAAGVSRACGGG
jgi:hypothetical protein